MKRTSNTKVELPWAINIDEFRKSGDYSNWNDEAVQHAIETLTDLTIIAINLLQVESKNKKGYE
jgi:hypothetical protein